MHTRSETRKKTVSSIKRTDIHSVKQDELIQERFILLMIRLIENELKFPIDLDMNPYRFKSKNSTFESLYQWVDLLASSAGLKVQLIIKNGNGIKDLEIKYYAELEVDLDVINEPMIADPDVNNKDVSKRYTHDTIRPLSFYGGTKKVDLGFIGSCMVHKGDMKILAQMLKNIEKHEGKVTFKAPLVVAPPTYNIVDELKAEGDWEVLRKYSGFEFDDNAPKSAARTEYENMLYLERPGCNLCMGNQEKASKGDTVMATSTRLFQGRVVEDTAEKKGESLLSSTPVVVLSTVLGRTPTIEEYKKAVEGIDLTKFAPPHKLLVR